MSMPENEFGPENRSVSWRLRRPGRKGVTGAEDAVIIELVDTMGVGLAAVSLTAQMIEELLQPHFSFLTELHLDGTVSTNAELFATLPPSEKNDVLDLIKQALAPEMLEDEPNAKEQLAILQQRLNEALALVDQTLGNLAKSAP